MMKISTSLTSWISLLLVAVILTVLTSCAPAGKPLVSSSDAYSEATPVDPIATLIVPSETPVTSVNPEQESLTAIGFSVQVGAFSQQENAVRLEQNLKSRGLDAFSFLDDSGLYKVRFGDHSDYQSARDEAEQLQSQGAIGRFFIVTPQDYAIAKSTPATVGGVRYELVKTAKRFIGVPYRWGGEDSKNGFDCSGLTMVSYRLNGLKLPRNSRAQYQAGRSVKKAQLQQGDLVFFATKGGTRVTHVGMYVGDGNFIHAPRTGKTIRISSLSSTYFRRTYVGGRSYL